MQMNTKAVISRDNIITRSRAVDINSTNHSEIGNWTESNQPIFLYLTTHLLFIQHKIQNIWNIKIDQIAVYLVPVNFYSHFWKKSRVYTDNLWGIRIQNCGSLRNRIFFNFQPMALLNCDSINLVHSKAGLIFS